MTKTAVAVKEYNFPEARLLAARILPYMRQHVVSLIPTKKEGLKGIAVDDSMRVYFDPDYLNELPMETAAGLIIHEVMHNVLNHSKRATKYLGESPDPQQAQRWSHAVDLVVNQIMREANIPLPDDALDVATYGFKKNLMPEEYYILLEDKNEPKGDCNGGDQPGGSEGGQNPGTGEGGGGSCGDGQQKPWEDPKDSKDNPGLDDHEQDMLRRQTAKACEDYEREKGRGNMPGYLKRFAQDILRPKTDPVRELLAQVKYAVNSISGHGDYTWKKMNRRQPPGGIRLPAHVQPIPRILVVVDTSGSMDQDDLALSLGVVSQVVKALPHEGVKVVAGDTRMAAVSKVFRPEQVELAGGGGTDMAKVLVDAAAQYPPPDAIICCTDGETGWPEQPIGPKVVAAITRRDRHYPTPDWMQVVEIQPDIEEE